MSPEKDMRIKITIMSLTSTERTNMTLKKYVKNRRKFKFFLLLMVLCLIFLTILILKSNSRHIDSAGPYFQIPDSGYDVLQQPIVPEKYNEREVKMRLIKEKIKFLTQNKISDIDKTVRKFPDIVTKHVQIFYNIPVMWFKRIKTQNSVRLNDNTTSSLTGSLKPPNIAYYPSLGLYAPNNNIIQKHFENIKNCGIGVLILNWGLKLSEKIFQQILDIAPRYNLTVTIEINSQHNRSAIYIKEQLVWVRKFVHQIGFYKVFSVSKNTFVPLIYVRNAHKIDPDEKYLCYNYPGSLRDNVMDAIFLAHIKFKQHTELIRRLCFDGFYTRLPSNGATYASTWKNWAYLKTFAHTYKLLFVPTVGPGYAERNKLPRHGNIQRHRSNGRYYGVAWRTAISYHVGFISIASYNNWQDGTQIEEVTPRTGFMDYLPGKASKYLDLTSHWVQNLQKTYSHNPHSCQAFFNNTIC